MAFEVDLQQKWVFWKGKIGTTSDKKEYLRREPELKRKIKLSDFMLNLITKKVHTGYDWNEYYSYW